jgi:folylpolyglutamate synthase
LNPIHIAGTKGKGSTAAFTSSILFQFVNQDPRGASSFSKVGLYTSPHLRHVRERIQINGAPLSEDQFAQYFFEVWDRLEDAAKAAGENPEATTAKPVYFRYLTLMAFHTYMREKVEVAVIECGIGGAYDSTNVIESPAVTAITNLGIDHVGMLGETIGEIAWHKSGIMKKDVPCFTPDDQPEDAVKVMQEVSQKNGSPLRFVHKHQQIVSKTWPLGLQGDFQQMNASVAFDVASKWLSDRGYAADSPDCLSRIARGLELVQWPGRCETRQQGRIKWCIDGAHTLESILLAGKWFASQVLNSTKDGPIPASRERARRVLIFNQQTRDADALAKGLFNTLCTAQNTEHPFTDVIFCTNTTFTKTGFKPDLISVNVNASDIEGLTVQRQLAQTWASLDPSADVHVVRTIEEAVATARNIVEPDQTTQARSTASSSPTESTAFVFVTGSIHLVGGFLEVLESPNVSETA